MTVADRIIRLRKELNLTQDDLAKMLGLSGRSSISKIEKAGNDITIHNINRIADALNCSPGYLMGYEDAIRKDIQSDKDNIIDPMCESLISYMANFDDKQKKLLESYIKLLAQEE